MKKVLKILVELGLISLAGLFAKTLYRAKQFKISCDINENALDHAAILNIEKIDLKKQPMKDLKLGAFLGVLECDLSDMEFLKREYDMTIVIDQGIIILTIPENIGILTTSVKSPINIIDQRKNIDVFKSKIIAIHADLSLGLLIIKNGQV